MLLNCQLWWIKVCVCALEGVCGRWQWLLGSSWLDDTLSVCKTLCCRKCMLKEHWYSGTVAGWHSSTVAGTRSDKPQITKLAGAVAVRREKDKIAGQGKKGIVIMDLGLYCNWHLFDLTNCHQRSWWNVTDTTEHPSMGKLTKIPIFQNPHTEGRCCSKDLYSHPKERMRA